jgi:DNA-binding NtrC family response regulator
MVILANGSMITVKDIPNSILKSAGQLPVADSSMATLPENGLSLNFAVGLLEKTLILQALDRTGWVKNQAAKLLKMNRTTLIEKMKKQNLMALSPASAKQNISKLVQ